MTFSQVCTVLVTHQAMFLKNFWRSFEKPLSFLWSLSYVLAKISNSCHKYYQNLTCLNFDSQWQWMSRNDKAFWLIDREMDKKVVLCCCVVMLEVCDQQVVGNFFLHILSCHLIGRLPFALHGIIQGAVHYAVTMLSCSSFTHGFPWVRGEQSTCNFHGLCTSFVFLEVYR